MTAACSPDATMARPLRLYRTDRRVLRVAQVVEDSRSEGPERRFVLWLQGCALRCPGCCNPELFDFDSPAATDLEVSGLLGRIRQTPGIEGITLLGGEPFHQAPAAGALAAAVHDLGLGVVVFTGYELDELAGQPAAAELLAHSDLLVAGPFVAAARSIVRPWVGSDNQQVHLLSPRYRGHPQLEARRAQSIHVVLVDGELRVTGWPAVADVAKRRPV
jgi:anaerobic ribonucleoside-triphosphate reductase activating protein